MYIISADKLGVTIDALVKSYNYKLDAEVEKAVRLTAEHCRDNIKENAPKRTGKYEQSWAVKYTRSKYKKYLLATVHASAPRYRLTHLLEKEHDINNQYGGSYGKTSPQPHIADAAKAAEIELEQRIETAVKNLGL